MKEPTDTGLVTDGRFGCVGGGAVKEGTAAAAVVADSGTGLVGTSGVDLSGPLFTGRESG